jgi:phosphoribosylanthranilate isomerase
MNGSPNSHRSLGSNFVPGKGRQAVHPDVSHGRGVLGLPLTICVQSEHSLVCSAVVALKIKICGITNPADALAAAEAGADALGFMFYPPSPRHVTREQARAIIRELPPFIAKVGVFVNASQEEVRQTIEEVGIDTLQFHGDEPPEFCRNFTQKVIKAFRIASAASLEALPAYSNETWLVDSFVSGKLGGTGSLLDWDLAAQATKLSKHVILAGGLTPDNAAEAVRQVKPFGLDVSSGVESAPGKKDARMVRAFIAAARNA